MSALRLAVDNTKTATTDALLNRAVRITADEMFPFGVFNFGIGEVLEKQLVAGDMNEFARQVRRNLRTIQSAEYERAGAGGFK